MLFTFLYFVTRSRETGYSPRLRFFTLPLTSELVDGSRSNANQRTAEQCLAESADPQPNKKPSHKGPGSWVLLCGVMFHLITLFVEIASAISALRKIPPRRYAAQRTATPRCCRQLPHHTKRPTLVVGLFVWLRVC